MWIFCKLIHFGPLLITMMLMGCAQYALKTSEIGHHYPELTSSILIKDSSRRVQTKMYHFLKSKGLKVDKVKEKQKTYFTGSWMDGASLRYYYLQFDNRVAHPSRYKVSFIIENSKTNATRVWAEAFEIIYVGPNEEASAIDMFLEKGSVEKRGWFEAPTDYYRGQLWLEMFLAQKYPTMEIPFEKFEPKNRLKGIPRMKDRYMNRCLSNSVSVNFCSYWRLGRTPAY